MAQPIAPAYGPPFLFPPALEDGVPADPPARFLREWVDRWDLAQRKFALPATDQGRPPDAARLPLKIWLYGYFHRIRATRTLETACREHLWRLWLTGLIAPDHPSLWRCWSEQLCTRDPKGRPSEVWTHTPLVQKRRARLQEPPPRLLYQKRRQIMERRLAPLKQQDGLRRGTVGGLEAVAAPGSCWGATLHLRILYKKWQTRLQSPKAGAQTTPTPALGTLGRLKEARPRPKVVPSPRRSLEQAQKAEPSP
jgi:hypothetical protein